MSRLAVFLSLLLLLIPLHSANSQADNSPIFIVAWSLDGTHYAIGDYEGNVKVWNTETNQLQGAFPAPDFNLYFPPIITSLSWHPNGNLIAVTAKASTQPTAHAWILDLLTGETVIFEAEAYSYSIAWSPDGMLLAHAVTQGEKFSSDIFSKHWIKIWDVASHQVIANLEGHTKIIDSVAWSPDGTRLASASTDGTTIIWDTSTWEPLLTFGEWGLDATLTGAWSPDGSRLAASGVNGTAGIWDPITGTKLMTLNSDDREPIIDIVWSPDGMQLASVSEQTIKLWDATTGQQIGKLQSEADLSTLAWSPDGTYILYGGIDIREPQLVDPAELLVRP